MHPSIRAAKTPDKPAYVMAGSGRVATYRELEETSNRIAHFFRSRQLKWGDNVAVMLPNDIHFYPIACAAQRSGLYLTALSSRLTAGEAEYIVRDAGTKLLITSSELGAAAIALGNIGAGVAHYMVGSSVAPFANFEDAIASQPSTRIADENPGALMLCSSGTTGRPKGVKHPLPTGPVDEAPQSARLFADLFGANENMVYLCPAPLYHAAPLAWSMLVHRFGGTVILMEHFDPEKALQLVEKYRVTHAQWVPTHFVRLLKLPADVRKKYDHSSLQTVFHAAAPCPVPIKEQMMEWWGPIIHEYYGGTENNGSTFISPSEWLRKKGSVGKPVGCEVHICSPEGKPLPAGEDGLVYFSGGGKFEYHNDPAKTAASRNSHGWTMLGDIGHLDSDGYLFLTDRKDFTIISGGVNIYPQEIENLLVTHPQIADAAVIGVPDEDFGEKVMAVIELSGDVEANDALRDDILAYCRASLSSVKLPRRIEFVKELPRHQTGKLYKRLLRDQYREKA